MEALSQSIYMYSYHQQEVFMKMSDFTIFQSSQYLQLSSRFKEFGFGKDLVHSALLDAGLDEEKTLDILTSS